MMDRRVIYFLLGLAVGCAQDNRRKHPPLNSRGGIEDVVADAGPVNTPDDVTTGYDTDTATKDEADSSNGDTPYDTEPSPPDEGNDSGNGGDSNGGYIVRPEREGIQIITTELEAQGYIPEVRSDHWSTIRLRNPQTGEYDLLLEPDVRFRRARNPPAYSFFEFNSAEDPGVGMESDVPFYREVQPATGEEIRAYIQRVLEDL